MKLGTRPILGDAESVRGIAECAVLSIGTSMGVRRPRTLTTAMNLRDVKQIVGQAILRNGAEVRVPCVRWTFREEKYDDIQGPHEAIE